MTRTLAHSTLVTVLLASGMALAQEGTYQEGFHPKMGLAMLSWEIGAPVGSLHAWEGNVTPSGGAFEVRSCVKKQLSVGVATNWNWFNQNINSVTETQSNVTFNGPLYRRLNTFALRGTGHYYFTEDAFQPYAGFGIGGIWTSTYQQSVNLARATNGFWFALDPEVGALYRVSPGLAFDAMVRYQWTTAQFSTVNNAAWFGFQIGIASMF
jgi:hypothetical protein